MKWNAAGKAEYSTTRHPPLPTQIGSKSYILRVLPLVGWWLSWQDWRNVEKVDKATHEWCQSEEATISLFGLWQERSKSLFEITPQLWDLSAQSGLHPDTCFDKNQIPFLGSCYNVHFYPRDFKSGGSVLY